MKLANAHIAKSLRRALLVLGTLAAVLTAAACSHNSKPTVSSNQPVSGVLRPAAMRTVVTAHAAPVAVIPDKTSAPVKPSATKLMTYRSRDYGVSFVYPWQYGYVSAKAINGDESLQPKSDGHDGQFTLVRVEVPKGFYPDTNFESGYFALSLNQDLSEQECEATLGTDGKAQKDNIDGVDYLWVESDSGGHGSAVRLRNYVTYAGGTCYEMELGVKTQNEQGLSREVDSDKVMQRLDVILRTVKIAPEMQKPAAPKVESAASAPNIQN